MIQYTDSNHDPFQSNDLHTMTSEFSFIFDSIKYSHKPVDGPVPLVFVAFCARVQKKSPVVSSVHPQSDVSKSHHGNGGQSPANNDNSSTPIYKILNGIFKRKNNEFSSDIHLLPIHFQQIHRFSTKIHTEDYVQ